jgi:phosphoribosylanthranilate isomerase
LKNKIRKRLNLYLNRPDYMPTRVKICGITRLDDAELAVELGASALGFNFFAPSPRYIQPGAALAITRQLPPLLARIGVFADESDAEHVVNIALAARLTAVQLHGPRFPDPYGLVDYPMIRAVPVGSGFRLDELLGVQASAFLLDACDPKLIGGTGRTINWQVAREARRFGPIILAGGLTPSNVGEAIRTARPFAVDVASGVESAPGKKDPAKLRAFFAAVAETDRSLAETQES